jgi:glycosyltransferase involved in cell wall biosynthesis
VQGCIGALARQTLPRDAFEVLMVDNGSSDGSAELVRKHPWIRLVKAPGHGPYHARNRGVEEARGSILAFTDVDCVPADDWLRAIDRAFDQRRVAVALGRVDMAGRAPLLRALEAYENAKAAWVCSASDLALYYGYTNNMAVRRSAFERAGPFEELARGGDTILVQKILQRYAPQAVVYLPEMRVEHVEIASARTWLKKCFVYGRSSARYSRLVPSRALTMSERAEVRAILRKQLSCVGVSPILTDLCLALGLLAFLAGRAC